MSYFENCEICRLLARAHDESRALREEEIVAAWHRQQGLTPPAENLE